MEKEKLNKLNKKTLTVMIIATIVVAGFLTPLIIWMGRPCQISAPKSNDWEEAFTWMQTNLSADTSIAAWGLNGDYIHLYSNCTSLVYCGMDNQTLRGLVGRQFMATNESESVEILTALNTSYVLISWSYYYPNGGGDEANWQSMIQSAHYYLGGTQWAIEESALYSESSDKPTCEFFNTTLWKMLLYSEPFINYTDWELLIDYFIQFGYPLGFFEARLNWADPWIPGSAPYQGTWEDDSGHLWKFHNPPLVDDGFVDYDSDGYDDTVGIFGNLTHFSPVFVSPSHLIKIFKVI